MDKKEISETLEAAKLYVNRLKVLETEISNAEKQIRETSRHSEQQIDVIFVDLIDTLTKILHNRRNELLKKVRKTKLDSLAPLDECHNVIRTTIEKTNKLISHGKSLLNGSLNQLVEFSQNSSKLGILPEIPELKEVPYISFQYQPYIETELRKICSQIGDVSRIAPVQISKLTERPGAILAEWHSVADDEKTTDIQEFRLQRAFGNVTNQPHLVQNFTDCFMGLETQYLLKDLRPDQHYSFRICCRFEGEQEWSPWSLPQVAATSIAPFAWANNDDYILSNENRIAKPTKDAPSLLVSDGAQFRVGYSVEFTFLEFDQFATIGLYVDLTKTPFKEDTDSFTVDSSGEIHVNGVKKATKLPEFKKGLKICFTCDVVNNEKVRINVDSCDKRVTYEWMVTENKQFYFATSLANANCKIMVE